MKKIYFLIPALAGVMFGSTGIFVRTLTNEGINSPTLLFLRFSIASIILFLTIVITDYKLFKIKFKDLGLLLLTGLCILLLNVSYNEAINSLPLSLAAVLLSTAPIFIIIFSYFGFNERLNRKQLVSILFVLIGCVFATGLLEENIIDIQVFGIVFGLSAALFYSFYTLSSKKLLKENKHTYTVLFYSICIISIVLLPFTNFTSIKSFILTNVSFNILFLIAHSLFSFCLPYIFLTLSLDKLESGIVTTILSGLEPISAMIFGLILYLEIPTVLMFVGIILTLVALRFLSKNTIDT